MEFWRSRFLAHPVGANEIIIELMKDPAFQHPRPPTVDPERPEPEQQKLLTARFLRDGAAWATHGLLSLPDDKMRLMLDQAQRDGNAFNFYLWCDGDYAGRYKLAYDKTRNDHWVHWIAYEMREKRKLEPIAWLMADDGFKHFDRNSFEAVTAKWSECIDYLLRPIGVKYVVLGLEAVEYWSDSMIQRLGQWLRAYWPGVNIGFHTHPNDYRNLDSAWIDTIYYQYGFGKDADFVINKTVDLINTFKKPVIAAEYSLDGDPELGRAAVKAGAVGALNGF